MINNLEHVDTCAVVTQPIVDWIDSTKEKIEKGEPEQEKTQ